jgi:hypothetical protein
MSKPVIAHLPYVFELKTNVLIEQLNARTPLPVGRPLNENAFLLFNGFDGKRG